MTDKYRHLICANCGTLLDCDWMGISIDYDDECSKAPDNEQYHIPKEVECDCQSKVIKQ